MGAQSTDAGVLEGITVYYGHSADHGDCETPPPRCTAANRDRADDSLSSDNRPSCAVPEFL